YPEHWPEARWTQDAKLMRRAGLEIVRVAEFAWAKMEVSDKFYSWAWLDRAIETFANAGHQLVLGTPTATPPAWLTRRHPGILRVDANGRSRNHGTRRHYCPNSPIYRKYSRRIVKRMAKRYGKHPNVIGWQTDNEIGGGKTARCYCNHCAAEFRTWLREKYGDVNTLNDAWGNIFWSQTYSDWSQINPPSDDIDKKNPSHVLDYYRFSSDSFVSYQQEQIDILRKHAPDHFVTHNFMGLYRDLDQFDLAAPLDFATWDNYPTGNPERWREWLYPPGSDTSQCDPIYAYDVGDPLITGMSHALTYALKDAPFWIMEQQCGQINWGEINPWVRPGTPRLWNWHALVEGADTIMYFRWRATLFAQEQYHSGLLRHDGTADIGYAEQQQMMEEKKLLDAIAAAPLNAEIALLFDFDDMWALQLQPHRADFNYLRHLFVYYAALKKMGVAVKLLSSKADLSPYKLVIAPTSHLAGKPLADKLIAYAKAGGSLLLGVRSGFKTESNLVTDQPLPGALKSLVGASITSWRSLPLHIQMPIQTDILQLSGAASYWVELLETDTAVSLASYTHESGSALTENVVGNGRCLYLGFYPTEAQATALLTHLTTQLGIESYADLPPGMVSAKRGAYTILLNFTDEELEATVGETAVSVPPRDVYVALSN
ncbi:MAG: beta-galactosidase, partial [Chloroflexi bacterium]|nr:beta-galactosidase [Chloroflexota bacterium]